VKLLYAQKMQPTVEGNHILLKWYTESDIQNADYVRAAYEDAVAFVKQHKANFKDLYKTYDWHHIDDLYQQRYG